MRHGAHIAIILFTLLMHGMLLSQDCDPIEYDVFYDSQLTTVPPDIQTGDVECYSITQNFTFQTGAIWSTAPIDLSGSFEYSYYVNLGVNDANGADGMVFVLSGDPDGQAAIGEAGGDLAYGGLGGISPSIALEIDTWDNGPSQADIPNDHAMLHYNGVIDGSAGPAIDLGNIEDGQYHLVEVNWDAIDMVLTIYFDGVLIVEENEDLVNNVFGGNPEVLIGFVGSTGGSFNNQIVCDVQVVYLEECNGIDDDCDGLIDEDIEEESFQNIFICGGTAFEIGESEYTTTGLYMDTLSTVLGCDSIVSTNLTVGDIFSLDDPVEICQGDIHTVGASVYSESGLYEDIFIDANGCDSIINTDLTVFPALSLDVDTSICEGAVYQEGADFYTTSGLYTNMYTTANGCDSVVTTSLEVLNVDTLTYSIQLCEGESWTTNQGTYPNGGDFEEVYIAANGCDSVSQFSLTIKPVFAASQDRFICTGGQFLIGSSMYSSSGVYVDTLTAANGCDSIVTTDLQVIDEFIVGDTSLCDGEAFSLDMNPFPYHSVNGFTDVVEGVYYFDEEVSASVEVDLDGCILSDEFDISILEIYSTEFHELQMCEDEELRLFGRSLPIDFRWLSGETSEEITILRGGEFVKEYTYRCGDFQDRFVVESSYCSCSVYLPNAFSPNSDLVNDSFGVEYECEFAEFDLSIYDRYGSLVFQTREPELRWNGGSKGYFLPSGIYQYRLVYSSLDRSIANDEVVIGSIRLIR